MFKKAILHIIEMDKSDFLEMNGKVSQFISQKLNIQELKEQYQRAITLTAR